MRYQTTLSIHRDVVCVRQSPAISGFQISSRYGVVIVVLSNYLPCQKVLPKNTKKRKIKSENLVNHSL